MGADTGHVADSLRSAYVHHVTRLLALSGVPETRAESGAQHMMALETALAQASLTRVAQREPRNIDHPMSLDSLTALVPNIDWKGYFQRSGLTKAPERINVAEPGYIERVNVLIDSVPPPVASTVPANVVLSRNVRVPVSASTMPFPVWTKATVPPLAL